MLSNQNSRYRFDMILIFSYAFICLINNDGSNHVEAIPATSVELFTSGTAGDSGNSATVASNQIGEDVDQSASSFRKFINSNPGSTVVGQLKPNASALDMFLLRNKIADVILKMQQMDKQQAAIVAPTIETSAAGECFIEITTVNKIPGKCKRANNGVPICQSDNYMSISNECV